ncbi:polysaccharide deacetylase family protein [Streptococcus cuniculipharyngis]|uniref:Polysaccharide deacetylase family protein n=1 Tax=Streptococcus cuniculipharyngis TaxID=1562651 RepID=A0A5C5SBT5_9STRE|nr:polysaccharide deacetylase family protein [Streptococcus cuniculipharyngis]TWS98009.1 polysaccharide deacetylase family protein [Streptococcus cuniculipharyngis]
MPYQNQRTRRILATTNIILIIAILVILALMAWQILPRLIKFNNPQAPTTASQTRQVTTPTTRTSNHEQMNWKKQEQAVQLPILMYHAIHQMAPEEANNANLILDPVTFEEHIKALVDAGYYFLSPEEAYKALSENSLPQEKVVWLTFDDSLIDFYTVAYPILTKYGVKATNNVITSYTQEGRPGNLTLEQMKEMKANGMSFQSHSVSHPDLQYSSTEQQVAELTQSKTFLDQELGQDTMTLAYPAGRYSDQLLSLTQDSYKLGLTTNEGIASAANGLLTLNRLRILPTTSADSLLQQLNP